MIRIYFDNCCYNRPFDNQKDSTIYEETLSKMFIQSLVKYRMLELVYSSISIQEIEDCFFEENNQLIIDFIENNAKYYVCKENNNAIISLVDEIMETGIKLKDASHAACAIIAKCDYLITTDKRLLKYKDNRIKIINPIDFVKMWRSL